MRILLVVFVLLLCSCDSDPPCIPQKPDVPGNPPIIQAQRDTSLVVGDTLRLRAYATDPDGDDVTFYATALLRDASERNYVADVHMDQETGDFWFVPGFRDMPDRTIMFTAVDEHGYSASTLFEVTAWYRVDQASESTSGGVNVILYFPVGQEFVPSLSALDVVQLWLMGGYSYSGPGEFIVNVRSETINGAIVGTSRVTTLPERYVGVASFEFERVALTAGQTYVIELVQLSGQNWLVGNGHFTAYTLGRMIQQGRPMDTNDLWFREGVASPLPGEADASGSIARKEKWR